MKSKKGNINSTTSSNIPSDTSLNTSVDSSVDSSSDSVVKNIFVPNKVQTLRDNIENKIQATRANVQDKIQTTRDDVQDKIQTTRDDAQDKIQTTTEIVDSHTRKLRNKINNTQKQIYQINNNLPVPKKKKDLFQEITNVKSTFDISSIVDKSKLAKLSENDTENLIAEIVKAKIQLDNKEKSEQLVLGAKNALSKYSDQEGGWSFTSSEPIKNNAKLENLFDSLNTETKENVHNKYLNLNLDTKNENTITEFDIDSIFVKNNTTQTGGYKTQMFKSFLSYLGVRFN